MSDQLNIVHNNSVEHLFSKRNILLDHCYGQSFTSLSVVKIIFVNVCGLKFPDFSEEINKFDICAFVETKLGEYDSVVFPNFKYLHSNRKKFKSKSGDVGLLIRKTLFTQSNGLNCADHCNYCSRICGIDNALFCIHLK